MGEYIIYSKVKGYAKCAYCKKSLQVGVFAMVEYEECAFCDIECSKAYLGSSTVAKIIWVQTIINASVFVIKVCCVILALVYVKVKVFDPIVKWLGGS